MTAVVFAAFYLSSMVLAWSACPYFACHNEFLDGLMVAFLLAPAGVPSVVYTVVLVSRANLRALGG
jgi:hypothetical protein